MALDKTPEWRALSKNHLEGRTAGFFSYGDGGGDEIGPDGRPRLLQHPSYFDPAAEMKDDRRAYEPLVWQCRYGGIEVPDAREYRAVGYEPPGHHLADLKLKWREIQMSRGRAPEHSSPRVQDDEGLNRDATFHPTQSTMRSRDDR